MSDATPSRPVPTRKIVDGVVEGTPKAPEAAPAVLTEGPAAPQQKTTMTVRIDDKTSVERPIPQNIPAAGTFNERGAQVAQAFVTSKAILRVDLK